MRTQLPYFDFRSNFYTLLTHTTLQLIQNKFLTSLVKLLICTNLHFFFWAISQEWEYKRKKESKILRDLLKN
ncbi:hypothetical protein AMR41_00490 [Hapalosiphon sp. MRB220]|nr:hypothetical protein AMR41_00490 [Hapalosiphon sp. MRB220]